MPTARVVGFSADGKTVLVYSENTLSLLDLQGPPPVTQAELQALELRVATALGVAPAPAAAQAPKPAPVSAPPRLSDLRWSQPFPVPPSAPNGAYGAWIGWVEPVGGVGPYRYEVADRVGDRYGMGPPYQPNSSGIVYLFYNDVGADADKLTVTVTDGRGDKVTKPISIAKTDGKSVGWVSGPLRRSNCSLDAFGQGPHFLITPFGHGHSGRDKIECLVHGTGTRSPVWGKPYDNIQGIAGVPAPGTYPLTIRGTNAADDVALLDVSLQIEQFKPIDHLEANFGVVSTSTQPGAYAFQLRATTPNNLPIFSIKDATGVLQCDAAGRGTVLRTPDTVGDLAFDATVTDGPATFTAHLTLPIVEGKLLPATKMTLSINPALDNATPNQHIGNVKLDKNLFTGTIRFSIVAQTRFNPAAVTAANPARIQINETTGSVDAPRLLSEGQDTIRVQATDGVTTCVSDFTIPVARTKLRTSYYIGPGNPKTRGAGVPPAAAKLGSFREFRALVMAPHRDLKHVWIDDVPTNPDAYTNDTGISPPDYNLRFALQGPGIIEWTAKPDGGEPVADLGGPKSNDRPGGGDMRGKGTIVLGDGDWTLIRPVVQETHGPDLTHGLEGVRKDGETVGDLTLIGGRLSNNDNGLETGVCHGIITADRVEFDNCGTSHVGAGACHNLYIGAADTFIMRGCTSRGATLGHLLKSRARVSVIEGCRLFDGLNGSSSCCADFPNGGRVEFRRNFVEKGLMAMNPFAVQFGAEGLVYDDNSFVAEDNTISILTLGGSHAGQNVGIGIWYGKNPRGAAPIVTVQNNRYYLSDKSLAPERLCISTDPAFVPSVSATVILTEPPRLDVTRPYYTGNLPARRPLYFHGLWGQDYYRNFEGVQQVADREEIVVSRTAAPGAIICSIYAHTDGIAQTPTKFGPGTTASLIRDGVYYPELIADPWAPDGMFGITTKADGSADLVVAGDLANLAAIAYVQIRFKAPDGTLCDSRYPIKVVA